MSHHSSQLEQIEAKSAVRWLFTAGVGAVLLVIALYWIDNRLSTSPRERDLGNTLRELRGAQAALPGRVDDGRQLMPFAHQANVSASEPVAAPGNAAGSAQAHSPHGE